MYFETQYVLARHSQQPISATFGTSWVWPGSAASANIANVWAGSLDPNNLVSARWLVAWDPNAGGLGNTGLKLVYFYGVNPETDMLVMERATTGPITGGGDITAHMKNMIAAGVAGGHEMTTGQKTHGNGVNGPKIYSSIIACLWRT